MSSSLSLCGDGEPDLLGQEAQQSAKRNAKLVLLRYNHRNLQKRRGEKKHFSPCSTTKDCMEQFGKFVS